jgi:hypothetical protein
VLRNLATIQAETEEVRHEMGFIRPSFGNLQRRGLMPVNLRLLHISESPDDLGLL